MTSQWGNVDPPLILTQTRHHDHGCRMVVFHTSSRTSPHPIPTSQHYGRNRCPPIPAEQYAKVNARKIKKQYASQKYHSSGWGQTLYWTWTGFFSELNLIVRRFSLPSRMLILNHSWMSKKESKPAPPKAREGIVGSRFYDCASNGPAFSAIRFSVIAW